ncbi:MAG: hypothetical protein MUQ10_12450 [Anaerolineae bacterium]|nr:hypothetical protein [Anaerolineae bacterium]
MLRLSWGTKLTGLAILLLGTLLLVQVLYVIPCIQNRDVEMAGVRQLEVARSIAWGVDLDLARARSRLMELSQQAAFRSMDVDAMQSSISAVAARSYRLESLYVMDAEGWSVASTITADEYADQMTKSYADRPDFIVPFEQGQVYFAPPGSIPARHSWAALSVCPSSRIRERG